MAVDAEIFHPRPGNSPSENVLLLPLLVLLLPINFACTKPKLSYGEQDWRIGDAYKRGDW